MGVRGPATRNRRTAQSRATGKAAPIDFAHAHRSGRPLLTDFDQPIDTPGRVVLHQFRYTGGQHPRVVVAYESADENGYKRLFLCRPIAFHSRRGLPSWVGRARDAVRAAIGMCKWLTLEEARRICDGEHPRGDAQ